MATIIFYTDFSLGTDPDGKPIAPVPNVMIEATDVGGEIKMAVGGVLCTRIYRDENGKKKRAANCVGELDPEIQAVFQGWLEKRKGEFLPQAQKALNAYKVPEKES
ncbi:MAG: hypothetical protein ACR2OR_07300 [Hyphomicrobiales bacterium]